MIINNRLHMFIYESYITFLIGNRLSTISCILWYVAFLRSNEITGSAGRVIIDYIVKLVANLRQTLKHSFSRHVLFAVVIWDVKRRRFVARASIRIWVWLFFCNFISCKSVHCKKLKPMYRYLLANRNRGKSNWVAFIITFSLAACKFRIDILMWCVRRLWKYTNLRTRTTLPFANYGIGLRLF